MRIGLFSDTYLPDINGVVSSIVTLQKELEKNGHEVFVIANHKGLLHSKREGNVLRLPGFELKWLYGYILSTPYHFSAKDDIKAMNLDLIHVHTEFGIGIFARIVAKDLGIPLVCTYHTMYEDYTHYINKFDIEGIDKVGKKVTASFSKMVVDTCEAVIAPSEKTREALVKYGVTTPIHIIPTGLDLDKFNRERIPAEDIQKLRAQYHLSAEDKVMLYVGRVAHEKSIDVVIRGFVKAAKSNPHYKLMIVGGGPDLEELKDLAASCGIADQVIFTDKQDRDLVPVFYAAMDGFVSASLSETQGMTFIEAAASGLPVFARHDDVLDDLLEDGKSGYFFEEDTFSDKVIEFFALDKETVEMMKHNARRQSAQYDCHTFYTAVLNVYEEAVNSYHKTLDVKRIKTMDDCVLITLLDNKEDEIKVLVSVEDYFAFEIKKDGVIHQSVLEELQLREKVLKAWRLCIRKISTKDRTRKEMYDILVEDGSLDIKQINDMIDKLEDKGYVNDTLYMFNQIEHKQRSLEGKGKIIRDLVKRGLPYESVSEALDTLGDATEKTKAFHYAQKLQLSIKGQSLKMKKQKMKQRLIVQGYSPTLADEVIAQMDFNEEAGEQAALLEKAIQKALKTYSKKYDGQELKNAILRSLIRKGFTSEDVLIAINGMEIFK
ncbi:glycosyltransferase [Dielma fastidiosa]|uniref:glycosyltransferase n=1 Tax=Dielma fastidiosa TaxID=1034346 RepID=UPI000E535CCA|nr:RecX family transcriptional regulator [Dielma fastidiosa]RHM99097.1 glycosyltransferase [Dielma fastidiosa]